MRKIPFKVSARAARLIGRENVSNADGAIIELMKNCYDADASICVIYFDNKYQSNPKELGKVDFQQLISNNIDDHKLLNNCYKLQKEKYILQEIDSDFKSKLDRFFRSKNSVYIIDNGDGMDDEILENHWMTIGTNNKEQNFQSDKKRIRTGAKGIGRFALDRLGSTGRLLTIPKNEDQGFKWKVQWSDFEQDGVNIDQVFADIDTLHKDEFFKEISTKLKKFPDAHKILEKRYFENGTVIEITDLRDDWKITEINKIFSNLEMLMPPKDGNDEMSEDEKNLSVDELDEIYSVKNMKNRFNMFLFCTQSPEKYGKVLSSVCDDYDYKLFVKLNSDASVDVTLHRNEFNLDLLNKKLFDFPEMKHPNYNIETFNKGYTQKFTSIYKLFSGYDVDKSVFDNLGAFDFTLYFLKRQLTSDDRTRYYQKDFSSSTRSDWLNDFGGIKLFRDSFRVRPYGENGGTAFDWLMLGDRAAKSPAAPSHKSGRWKVRPNQVTGIINISRINNINFEDKSSREGLQETTEFFAFVEILQRIIQIFEEDRQKIMRLLNTLYEDEHEETLNKEKAKKLAEKVIMEAARKPKPVTENSTIVQNKDEDEKNFLAKQVLAFTREREELITEMKLLRGLASTGLLITSFAHELKNLSANILPRTIELKDNLKKIINDEMLRSIKRHNNPFIMIDDFRDQDQRLKNWLDFSLNVIRKDKRTRRKINLYLIFEEFERTWKAALSFQSVSLNIPRSDKQRCNMRLFHIDMDSIFNNFLANSLDAFQRSDAPNERNITIDMYVENNNLVLTYADTGPGLSLNIQNPNDIFESFFTTKVDSVGKAIGTGLGMWIIKTTVEEYKGSIEIVTISPGFKVKMTFPLRADEGVVSNV